MTDDETARAMREAVDSWMRNRDRIVGQRQRAEHAGIFAANQGTHLAFLRQLERHAEMLRGALPDLNPLQLEGLQELINSLASMSAARPRIITHG